MLKIGANTISKIYLGLNEIKKAYKGSALIFQSLIDLVIDYYNRVIADSGTFEAYDCVQTEAEKLLGTESFVFIPSAYKAGKVYVYKSNDGLSDFTFTRNSTDTRISSDLISETVGLNVPLIDYEISNCPTLKLPATTSKCLNGGNVDSINSLEGTAIFETSVLDAASSLTRLISIDDGSNTHRINFYYTSNKTIGIIIFVNNVNVFSYTFEIGGLLLENLAKFAIKWSNGDYSFWYNGTKLYSTTQSTVFSANILNNIQFQRADNTRQFIGRCKLLKIHNTALSDNLIISETTPNETNDYSDYDIIVEMGQSNMEGRDGDTTNPSYPFTSINGYEMTDVVISDISTLRGDAINGSHANYFVEKYYTLTNRKPVMLELSQGGTGLTATASATNWGDNSTLRYDVEFQVSKALHYFGKSKPKAGLWCQGERDAQEMDDNPLYTKAIVKSAMQDVIDWWQNRFPNIPFLISETGDLSTGTNTQGWQDMRAIQNEIVAENTNVYIAFTGAKNFPSEGKMVDTLHYNYVGLQEMGEAFAQKLSEI